MDEFQEMALYHKEKAVREQLKQETYESDSKERLKKNVRKKMTTIMIGSLSAIEEKLGFLWGQDSEDELTDGQVYVADLFQELRSQILDLGNAQIRNAETEIDMYTINWDKYTYQFQIKPIEEKKD